MKSHADTNVVPLVCLIVSSTYDTEFRFCGMKELNDVLVVLVQIAQREQPNTWVIGERRYRNSALGSGTCCRECECEGRMVETTCIPFLHSHGIPVMRCSSQQNRSFAYNASVPNFRLVSRTPPI